MPPPNNDKLRPELDEENTRKVRNWESQLRERYGVSLSPQRIVNLLISGVEFFDIEQTLKVGLADPPGEREPAKRKKPRLIIKTTLGGTR